MSSKHFGLLAMMVAAAVMWAIPSASAGKPVDLHKAGDALKQVTTGLGNAVDGTLSKTQEALRQTRDNTAAALRKAKNGKAEQRATATDPKTQPPLHGSDPHAQGGVLVVDLNPSSERPLSGDPTGKTSGEDVIIGRARGEQVNGAYHGHITILSLFGSELSGVDSTPGQSNNGPLQPIQTGILDPLCNGTANQVCLSVLVANSATTATGTSNDFKIARASVLGLGVGAAESQGVLSQTTSCQTGVGASQTANVNANGGAAVAQVANANTSSQSCRGQAPVVTNKSTVIGLGGVGVGIPAAGCANGTPDTIAGIPAVLPIVCNADDIAGAAAVREALDVYVLQVGGTSLAKETTASSEAFTVAPAEVANTPQCSDGIDNDDDGVIDTNDPGCHSDNDATNASSYRPSDDDETDKSGPSKGSGDTECADKRDNDGDGKIDADDPGCHIGNDINNPYNPDDDSEGSDGGGGGGNGGGNGDNTTDASSLPFTGTDVVGISLAGLLMLAGGMLLRRREGTHTL
ncbi:MAG: hypothetical protein QOI73_819 [Solirubrobacteraceae bacterium]|nr:hypothetical protein [Solirubrobacteraceae bacterium]